MRNKSTSTGRYDGTHDNGIKNSTSKGLCRPTGGTLWNLKRSIFFGKITEDREDSQSKERPSTEKLKDK